MVVKRRAAISATDQTIF